MALFDATLDDERLLTRLKAAGVVPENINHLTGLRVFETVDEEEVPGLSVIVGPLKGGRRGRRPLAIPVATSHDKKPDMHKGKVYKADIAETDDGYELIRAQNPNAALRMIGTGLVVAPDGTTTNDWAALGEELKGTGRKPCYHGVFPLTPEAGKIIGESLDGVNFSAISKVITDDKFGRVSGIPGLPKHRRAVVQGVIGGPLLVAQINGVLKVHELRRDGWHSFDVTKEPDWQDEYLRLVRQDVAYMQEVEAAEQRGKRDKTFTVTKIPSEHPDS